MVPAVTATVTRPMMVVMSPVLVVVVVAMVFVMMVVIKNRTQCNKRDRRYNNIVAMTCPGRRTGEGQGKQATNRHDLQLAGLQLLHFNLQFMSTMAAM